MTAKCGAVVAAVRPDSIAAEIGLRAGDCILTLNGAPVRDQVDYRFQMAGERIEVEARRGDEVTAFDIEKDPGEDLGLEFAEATFDGVRRCRNRCLFCFVDRLPRGMRSTLYVKDDDYRYSFLFGSFITLTNLSEADWTRLEEQRLTPLFVSVHATDLAARRRLLDNPAAPDVVAQLRRLAAARIQVHAQVVLCPGINDGEVLGRTIADLAELHSSVLSVAVVPVGLTRFGPPGGPRQLTLEEMAAALTQVKAWQRRLRRSLGRTFVHLGDEFYLRTGTRLPGTRNYDGFPQYQNGVGLARVLLDEWLQARRRLGRAADAPSVGVVTGELAAPLLGPITAELGTLTGATIRLDVVRNVFFGHTVNVAGLLTAEDVIGSVRQLPPVDVVALPRAMFDSAGVRTLDGMSVEEIERKSGTRVAIAGSIAELVRLATRAERNRGREQAFSLVGYGE